MQARPRLLLNDADDGGDGGDVGDDYDEEEEKEEYHSRYLYSLLEYK